MSGSFHQVLEMQGQSASDGRPPRAAVQALLPGGAELLHRMHAWQGTRPLPPVSSAIHRQCVRSVPTRHALARG